ncbi:leucine-rich repeat domain-containing protein [Kordia jejudonensis]|uniref:leucine-rich repeat domain-containing protein n=1 Tax=Kordia jejudonensis TaxID=1348245 RepID=UPI0006292DA8|nr:leucine-rich repeat domain-containing protein [Kordia jejudonensis]
MKKLFKYILISAFAIVLQNCKNDDFTSEIDTAEPISEVEMRDQLFQSENFGNTTTGNFFGLVADVDGFKLENVQITIGNTTTMTDRNGMFVLNNADVFENFAYIKAKKDGYIDGSRVVIPKTEGANKINIVLLKKEVTATINSGQNAQVSLSNGGIINFSGDYINAEGSTYSGAVDVVVHYLRPNSFDTFQQMPGSLFAQDASNNAQSLETYGMLSVNLFSPSGDRLNIDPESPATLEFPVDYSQTSIAPETINLWYFDEEVGYWKEDGQAIKDGNTYYAEVTHFTWWNCDIPFDPVELCFNLAPNGSNQSTPYYVIITRAENNQTIFSGSAYSGEFECGLIPRNEEIIVSIYQVASLCFGQLIATQTIGGYATDTSTTISFDESVSLLTTTITGTVTNCNGAPITNGYMYVDEYNIFAITDGTINVGLQHCEIQNAIIQIFDFDTNQWNIVDNVPLNTQNFNLGTVSTCDDTGGFFNGNLRLSTQQEVNDFMTFGFVEINGSLIIGDENNYTDITDLSPLASIISISEDLKIIGNENLQTLSDLANITHIGNAIIIENNPSLTALQGFTNITSIYSLQITNNDQLTSLAGCENFTSLNNLKIADNDGLTSLSGFNNAITVEANITISGNNALTSLQGIEIFNLTSQNDLRISSNASLTSLQGIENITTLRFVTIHNNDALSSLADLGNLTSILDLDINDNDALINLEGIGQLQARSLIVSNNDALQSLNGIENITISGINNFSIINIGVRQWEGDCGGYIDGPNPNLTNLCALDPVLINSNWNNNYCVVIVNNAYNPSGQDILNGNCSQ